MDSAEVKRVLDDSRQLLEHLEAKVRDLSQVRDAQRRRVSQLEVELARSEGPPPQG
ncbi:MAG: hypothetical protein AAGH15_15300 [Myxococcota bacterium]